MLIRAAKRTQWSIKMRLLQSMTDDEYCNVYGERVKLIRGTDSPRNPGNRE